MENEPEKTPIEHALGLGSLVDPIAQLKNDINDNSALTDFNTSRANIQTILNVGSNAVTELGILASQSGDPEAYAALSRLIKDVSDASIKLINLHEQLENVNNKKTIKQTKLGSEEGTNVNLFFSTSDVFRAIKEIDGK